MAFLYVLDPATPGPGDLASQGDDQIRTKTLAIRERVNSLVVDVDADPWVIKAGGRAAAGFIVGASDPGGTEALRINGLARAQGLVAVVGAGSVVALMAQSQILAYHENAVGAQIRQAVLGYQVITVPSAVSQRGVEGYSKSTHTSGVVAELYGGIFSAEINGVGGAVTTSYGLAATAGIVTAAGSATEAGGLLIGSPIISGGGTLFTIHGIRVRDITGGITANYSLRTGLGLVQFGDALTFAGSTASPGAGVRAIHQGGTANSLYFNVPNTDAHIFTLSGGAALTIQAGSVNLGNTMVMYADGGFNTLSGVYSVNGVQVVGARLAAITPPVGGAVIDVECRTAVTTIIARLQTHGLVS